ncbi:hypothetical protein LXA43DRAFT_1114337, partial [Ganoderma leucocontextum]
MPPLHERNLSSLAAKGKAKESVHWHLGWWDLCHSLEGTGRPVQWSKSSVIFTAHESSPMITGRHFPTSRQFDLIPPILDCMTHYERATVISLCPTDDWLFAYFPGINRPGIGCVWHREAQLDRWSQRECWSYPIGGGVVTAAWSCHHREWAVSDAGTSSRLPPVGPLIPLPGPTLILVTEAHLLHVYNISSLGRTGAPTRATLLQPNDPLNPPTDPESTGKIGGDRVCVKAAIGLCYQYPAILVAMRSALLPSQNSTQTLQQLSMDLALELVQPQPPELPFVSEWELWGEEPTISLCEVRIEYRAHVPPVFTRPLPPIHHPSSRLVNLVFYCPPPSHAPNPPMSVAPKADPKGPMYPLYLAATFLDFDDYTTIPKSEIVSYTFVNGLPANYWGVKSEARRPSQTKVPCFLLPSNTRGGFVAGFLDAGGLLPRRKSKSKETIIGSVEMLKPANLATHEDWENVPIVSNAQAGSIDVPVSVALSPNETLVCCISSPLLGSHFSIQALPRRVSGGTASMFTGSLQGDLSRHLVAAIRARYSPSDVIHALAMPPISTEAAVNTLYQAFTTMESDSNGLKEMWTAELLGVAAEVYGARTQRLDRGPEQELCAARRQTAHEIASLSACCSAFDTCREGDAYDLDAVWQLLGMTGWVIEFVEKLFKECIFVGERPEPVPSTPELASSVGKSLDSPIFLHLVHPYALTRLKTSVEHVKRFHDHVCKLPAKGEESHIAKDVLLDITEGIGIDLHHVGALFAEIVQETKGLDAQDLRRSLASCCPVPALKPQIRKAVDKVLRSKAIDRARLFIKPIELSDGVARLALSEPSVGTQAGSQKDKNTDVVKKGALARNVNRQASVCVRCGGRSDVPAERKMGMESALGRWQTWEKSWQLRCVCGGLW